MHAGTWSISSADPSDLIFSATSAVNVVLTIRKIGADPAVTVSLQVNGAIPTNGNFVQGEMARTFRLASVTNLRIATGSSPFTTTVSGEYEITVL